MKDFSVVDSFGDEFYVQSTASLDTKVVADFEINPGRGSASVNVFLTTEQALRLAEYLLKLVRKVTI